MSDTQYIYIDKDSLELLQTFLFKSTTDAFIFCSRRAYLDFNRTLHLKKAKKDQNQSDALFVKGTKLLHRSILQMTETRISSQNEYDNWHSKVCTELRELYRESGVSFTYGQAQKWLNMMMKYLYVHGAFNFEEIFEFLHPPLDNYILKAVQENFGIPSFPVSWSRLDCYATYLDYQKALRTKIYDCPPLRWEFRVWSQMAQKKVDDLDWVKECRKLTD